MDIAELQKQALVIADLYDQLNNEEGRITWSDQQLLQGFVGDVGDLSKIIMARNKLRPMDNVEEKLAHELADCLWSILVLAAKCNVDISQAFTKNMKELEEKLRQQLG